MIDGLYLSEAIDLNNLQYGVINLISSNCGSGKTFFALNSLTSLASDLSHVVYLTDSVAMKDSLSKEENCKIYDKSDRAILNGELTNFDSGKIIVMTYAKMGLLLKHYPDAFNAVEIIICDEIHRLYDFIQMSKKEVKRRYPGTSQEERDYWISVSCGAYLAYTHLEKLAMGLSPNPKDDKRISQKLIIGLSATPKKAYVLLKEQIHEIKINAQLVAYETIHTQYYSNLATLISKMKEGTRAIFYVPYVKDIIKCINLSKEFGFRANGIWSLENDHKMDEEQLKIRNYILTEQKLPDNYDFIFINAAYETSINIFDTVDCMVIHSRDLDTRIQARNRLRNDLEVQYLLINKDEMSHLNVPIEFLETPLTSDMKKELSELLGFRDSVGRKVGWTTTKKKLAELGYSIKDCKRKINNKSTYCSIITRND